MSNEKSTILDSESVEKWHREEKEWWEKYAEIMAYQWKLTPKLNKILRQELEDDYNSYLFKSGGKLLDLGCGSGWLSIFFAEKGMSVLGIDFSQEQITAAEKVKSEKRADTVTFECRNLAEWDCVKYADEFDSVFINAFLHHLPPSEIETIMNKVAFVLKQGGKAYFYEPLTSVPQNKSYAAHFIQFLFDKFIGLLVAGFPQWFKLRISWVQDLISKGYKGCSPHERPLDIEWLIKHCLKSFNILEIKCWHLYSLGFAMQSMTLIQPLRILYCKLVPLIYWCDKVLLSIFGWSKFTSPQRFILCSLKAEKNV